MKQYDVLGIGNAIVDVISRSSDAFLEHMQIEKGIMQLIERDRAEHLYAHMENPVQAAGGSVANTLSGLGALGVKTAFIGRVCDDELGRIYEKATKESGTDFVNSPVLGAELPTSRSMIFVSPDGERSMNTYLGVSAELGPDDIPVDVPAQAKIVFLEGYLFDKDKGKDAFVKLARECRASGGQAGITISDPFCVERHRKDFLNLIENELDYVIGNQHEITGLFETDDLEYALSQAANICPLVVCTRSDEGVSAIKHGQRVDVTVDPIVPVDSTGAGDQFAAGFLFGLAKGLDLKVCCEMGCVAAGEVIRHIGPRPKVSIMDLFMEQKLI